MAFKMYLLSLKSLNSPFKMQMHWKEACNLKCDTICYQATHFDSCKPPIFRYRQLPHSWRMVNLKREEWPLPLKTLFNLLIWRPSSFIILICEINQVKYTLVNLYLPNTKQISFLNKILKKNIHIVDRTFNSMWRLQCHPEH